jgi:S-disulfanyl-L-cysteine oxidoreductase SoxD
MSRRLPLIGLCVVGALIAATAQGRPYNIGRKASTAEIRNRDISLAPDGTGLPLGRGTAIQGRAVYRAKCAGCHGVRGQGSAVMPALVGGRGTLASEEPLPTVGSYWPYATTVWDYIHRAMPYQNPGTLTSNEVYSVTAYVLFANKIIKQHDELNEQTLPKVKMPNRSGFIRDPRPDVQ